MSGTPMCPVPPGDLRGVSRAPDGPIAGPVEQPPESAPIGPMPDCRSSRMACGTPVEHREGRLFHKATWRDGDGSVLAEIEAEVRYALGSGTRGVAFLIEREG